MITYSEEKNHKSNKKFEQIQNVTTILKTFDTFVIIATTSCTIILSLRRIRIIAAPISTAAACGLSIGNKVV